MWPVYIWITLPCLKSLCGFGDFPSTSGGQRGISIADMFLGVSSTISNNSKEGFWCLVFCFVCLFLGALWLSKRALSTQVRHFLAFILNLCGCWCSGSHACTASISPIEPSPHSTPPSLRSRPCFPFHVVLVNSVNFIWSLCFSSSSALPSIVEGFWWAEQRHTLGNHLLAGSQPFLRPLVKCPPEYPQIYASLLMLT